MELTSVWPIGTKDEWIPDVEEINAEEEDKMYEPIHGQTSILLVATGFSSESSVEDITSRSIPATKYQTP